MEGGGNDDRSKVDDKKQKLGGALKFQDIFVCLCASVCVLGGTVRRGRTRPGQAADLFHMFLSEKKKKTGRQWKRVCERDGCSFVKPNYSSSKPSAALRYRIFLPHDAGTLFISVR